MLKNQIGESKLKINITVFIVNWVNKNIHYHKVGYINLRKKKKKGMENCQKFEDKKLNF